jgi:predicted lipid-binding transport protein (Tim44 family)
LRYTFVRREFPGSNPIANALVVIVGALVIAVSIVLGFFAFIALAALVLLSAAVIGIRVWWLQRKLARRAKSSGDADGGRAAAGIIEGEYRVIREERDEA